MARYIKSGCVSTTRPIFIKGQCKILTWLFDKILHIFLIKNPFFMFIANFIFVVSHLKTHPVVHLNTLKALTSFNQKEKFMKKFASFCYSDVLTHVKKR